MDIDPPSEIAGADPLGPLRDRPDRSGHAAGEQECHQGRSDQAKDEQQPGADRCVVERRERFTERSLDKDSPAELRDQRMRGQYRMTGEIVGGAHRRLPGLRIQRGGDLRQF